MTSLYLTREELEDSNPLDLIESIIADNDWSFDRQGNNELTVGVEGSWCQYHLWFSWRSDLRAIHFSCAYDVKIPERQYGSVYELLARVNERMPVGHFDTWREEGMILFRHSLLLSGACVVTNEQIQTLVEIGMSELEKFYPAIQFCLWGGKTPEDAIEAAMFETMGEA
ncbi:YbjN domain-containing protein [Sneathiella sp. CAU 1612]|uniref:YbjN domain-containing protein n=1 Tax=Sneathiella sedimenti TaxID=2816034 RepID=A0ABS3F3X3_9PROT|nr:YbjN domain-containing protein [Sneathiella sedimenti]MBO0333062.1 YbjN domain-containing protein [Sneathiella sedimenti]